MKRAALTSMMVVLLAAVAVGLLKGEVCADPPAPERAIWVWGMVENIVLDDPAGSRGEFFNFCDSPHGDPTKKITIVYLSSTSTTKDILTSYPEELRGFLAAAHSRGLKIECLDGSKTWATPPGAGNDPPNRVAGENRCDAILNFNKGGASDVERFDGIHYDVEPQGLQYSKGDSYDWDIDNSIIWPQYLLLLTNCKAKVTTYNASYTPIKFGVDIAWWFGISGNKGSYTDVQTRVDYVTLMDYRQTGTLLVDGASAQISYGNSIGKKVYIGVETAPATPPDTQTITFFEEGNSFMEEQLAYVATQLGANASYGGCAIHYYEDISKDEWGYRRLYTDTFPGYPPVVQVTFPNGDEGVTLKQGTTYNITWTATDADSHPEGLTIAIAYSTNGGNTWTNVVTLNNVSTGNGTYAWDTTGLANGTQYRVKVTATDPLSLSQYDTSDYNFAFSSTPSPITDWGGSIDALVNGLKPSIIPKGNNLHMVWYWSGGDPGSPGWGGFPKGVYYKKSTDNGLTWGPTAILAEDNTAEPRKPAMAISSDGNNLAVVWVEGSGPYAAQKVKVSISSDGGGTWAAPVEVQGTYTSYKWADFPDIAVDSSNNIHVAWGARYLNNSSWAIHYVSRTGTTWSTRKELWSDSNGNYVSYGCAPSLTTDANGVHAVWSHYVYDSAGLLTGIAGSQWRIVAYRRKSGATWLSSTNVAGWVRIYEGTWTKYFPRIYSDSSNKLHVVWQGGGGNPQIDTPPYTSSIYYSSSTNAGSSWTTTVSLGTGYCPTINGITGEIRVAYYCPNAATSGSNDIGDIRYRKSADAGSTWTTEAVLSTDTKCPYWNSDASTIMSVPYIAVDSLGNNMVTAWRGYSNEHIMFSYNGYSSPTNLFANLVNGSSNALLLKWDKSPGHTPYSYSLYRSENSGAYSLMASSIYNVKYTDTGLLGAKYYKYKVTAMEGTTETRSTNCSNALYPGDIFLLDNFEGYEGMSYSTAGTSTLTYAFDTSVKKEGNQSVRFNYTYANDGKYGAVFIGTLPTVFNLLDYWTVKFWAKGGTAGKSQVAFQLVETGKLEGNETWRTPPTTITDTDWTEYTFDFSDLVRADVSVTGGGNFKIDTNAIGAYGLFFDAGNVANGTYYVDQIRFLRRAGTVSIPSADYTFQPVPLAGSPNNRRFVLGPIAVNFAGYTQNWTVRIYTKNNPDAPPAEAFRYAGLQEINGANNYIPLKVWCANYGPIARRPLPAPPYPDEENDYFWNGYDFGNGTQIGRQYQDGEKAAWYISGTFDENYWGFDINGNGNATDVVMASRGGKIGEEPVWLRVPEYNEMDLRDRFTWRRLCYLPGADLSSPFDIYLAVDVTAKCSQQYQTTTLTIEYINE